MATLKTKLIGTTALALAAPSETGATLEHVSDEAKTLLTEFKTTYKRDTTLDLDTVQKIWDDAPAGNVQVSDLVAAMLAAEDADEDGDDDTDAASDDKSTPEDNASMSATDRDKDAIRFGRKIGQADGLMAEISDRIEVAERMKRHMAAIAFWMSKTTTAEERAALPKPGSKSEGDGNNKAPVDIRGPGKGSFWGDVFDETPVGVSIGKQLAALAARGTDAAPNHINDLDDDEWENEKKRIGQQRTNGLRILKDAYNLLSVMATVKAQTKLDTSFRLNQDGSAVASRTATILVQMVTDDNKIRERAMTANDFLRVKLADVVKHETAEAQFRAFVVFRKPRTKDKKDTVNIVVRNADHFVTAVYQCSAVADNDKVAGGVYAILNSDEGGEALSEIFKLEKFLHDITRQPEMQRRYRAYQEAQAKAEKILTKAA